MEGLVERGKCRATGLSDITVDGLLPVSESARIKPAVVQVEAHLYLPEAELLEFCKLNGIASLAFAQPGHEPRPAPLEGPVISAIAARVGKTAAQVLLAWALQRGTAMLTTPGTAAHTRGNCDISALPDGAFDETDRIHTRRRFDKVVETGSPGFIPQGEMIMQVKMNALQKDETCSGVRDQEIRSALDQHWAASDANDFETEHRIYHEDAVLEYPQSGERTRGRRNIQNQRATQPSKKRFTIRRIIGSGDLWVTEFILTYDGKPSYTVSVMEFKGDKVARETQYFADPFVAPAWRSQWVERMDA